MNVGDTNSIDNEVVPKEVENKFENVLDVANNKVHITATIKGGSNAEKTINTALVYLWGKSKFLGQEWAEAKEIRQLCEEQACLDPTNFSAQMKKKKEFFLIDGIKGSNTKKYKLTKPGVIAAEDLLGKLNAG